MDDKNEGAVFPEVVNDDGKKHTVWCPDKGHQKDVVVCEKCENKAKCPSYAEFLGIDRVEHAKELDAKIENLRFAVFDTYFELGETLLAIREGIYYKELGFDSLDDYAATRHGFRYRKASYLIAIVENCGAAGIPKEDVIGIEWSKMKELPDLTEDNRAEWLKKAAELSVEELKAEVKKSKGEKAPEKKITMTFSFSEGQKELIDRALNVAAKVSGSDVKSYHLQIMAEEFLATYGDDSASTERFKSKHPEEENSGEED